MAESDWNQGKNDAWRNLPPAPPNPTHTWEQNNDRINGHEAERKRIEEAQKTYKPNGT
jgi:hypothetical protein